MKKLKKTFFIKNIETISLIINIGVLIYILFLCRQNINDINYYFFEAIAMIVAMYLVCLLIYIGDSKNKKDLLKRSLFMINSNYAVMAFIILFFELIVNDTTMLSIIFISIIGIAYFQKIRGYFMINLIGLTIYYLLIIPLVSTFIWYLFLVMINSVQIHIELLEKNVFLTYYLPIMTLIIFSLCMSVILAKDKNFEKIKTALFIISAISTGITMIGSIIFDNIFQEIFSIDRSFDFDVLVQYVTLPYLAGTLISLAIAEYRIYAKNHPMREPFIFENTIFIVIQSFGRLLLNLINRMIRYLNDDGETKDQKSSSLSDCLERIDQLEKQVKALQDNKEKNV